MKKRIIFLLFTGVILCSLFYGNAIAAEQRASDILSRYNIASASGDNVGEIDIKYDVRCSMTGTVGVESIEIYKSNGIYVTTITGTIGNGLLKSGSTRNSGTYTYTGTSGTSYYAVVTISAESGSVYDSRVITTSIVKAP